LDALGACDEAGLTVRKIAVVGGECTGKTMLCQELARALPGLWIAEYLREFTERAGRPPFADEEASLLSVQIEREANAVKQAERAGLRWIACDSAPIATAIHAEMYFDDRSLYSPAERHHTSYALTLLTDIDLGWVADGIQRDGLAVRADFHSRIQAWLDLRRVPYALVSGQGEARTASAIARLRAVESSSR
jgi:nicotinamide riboside kinase